MCPVCWAVVSAQLVLVLVGVALANLSDLKFGLWLVIGLAAQLSWNWYAVGTELMVIHPAILWGQLAIGASRGATLLEAPHWFKGTLAWIGQRAGAGMKRVLGLWRKVGSSQPRVPQWLVRAGHFLCTYVVGSVLVSLVDFRLGVPLVVAAAVTWGLHLEGMGFGSWGSISSVSPWIPTLCAVFAFVRGVVVIRHRQNHWIRSLDPQTVPAM